MVGGRKCSTFMQKERKKRQRWANRKGLIKMAIYAKTNRKKRQRRRDDKTRRVKNTPQCEERVQAWRGEPSSANERSPDN